jgi:hypothetical protein
VNVGNEKELEAGPFKRQNDPAALAGGIFGVVLVLGLVIALPVIADAAASRDEGKNSGPEPFEYIEARLLKQGEVKDPDKMPDRIVPALPTAPEDVLPLDKQENKPEEKKDEKQKPQADAVTDDKLRQVFDKARAFAEIQDNYIPEGSPDGVPDGDVTDPNLASLGATYGHRIKAIFLERWVVPTLLSQDVLKGLSTKINIKVDLDMVIVSATFIKKSGNPMFDDSVQNAIDRVIKEVRTLPPPPEAIASNIFGGGINLKFNGKEATYE